MRCYGRALNLLQLGPRKQVPPAGSGALALSNGNTGVDLSETTRNCVLKPTCSLQNVALSWSSPSLMTVDGVTHATFKDAAVALGLLVDDADWDSALEEASSFFSVLQIRHLHAIILEFEVVVNAKGVWEKHKEAMSEDIVRKYERNKV